MLSQKYTAVRQRSEKLCQPLTAEDTVPQFVEFASPPKWHLAHTSWFFEEMLLKPFLTGYKVFNPAYGQLFNSYYQGLGAPHQRSLRGIISRPGLHEVYAYRAYVDEKMQDLLGASPSRQMLEITELGMNHEQQHQELLITDLKLAFAQNPMWPVYDQGFDEAWQSTVESNHWLAVDEGVYSIGHRGTAFCFDNELAAHEVQLQSFEISQGLISNGEYLEFINDGGYQEFSHWLDEGWAWVQGNQIRHPLYWQSVEGQWQHFTLNGLQPLSAEAPLAHISYYEADAFATWRGCRLPSEFEWEAASSQINWGQRWEWTASAYAAYPGFSIGEGAVGEYNGKFMVNQLVLRGASVATPAGHSRATYRNFFHPHHQWQYSGLRLAR